MRRIYLDNAATTSLLPQVVDAMMPWLREQHGNPSSAHAHGRAARVAVERAREHVAAMIGADPREIIFTAGGTESDNTALHMALHAHTDMSKLHVISSAAEHHAVHMPIEALGRGGAAVGLLPVDAAGVARTERITEMIRPETVLCSLMHVNNETGGILPLEQVGTLLHQHDVLFHSDIVQSAGKLPIDIHAARVDFAAMSAHKIHGPEGRRAPCTCAADWMLKPLSWAGDRSVDVAAALRTSLASSHTGRRPVSPSRNAMKDLRDGKITARVSGHACSMHFRDCMSTR
jgi:cysteine desulfurase